MGQEQDYPTERVPRVYWLVAAIVVAYVAACTGYRDNIWGADAWEHHRVVKALVENIWAPGNPTHALEIPSPRYSPYAVLWAAVCRLTGLDPYTALSIAATINTAGLVVAVAFLLARFGEARSAVSGLVIMLSLYGGAPGISNSYALEDLPCHQVNFSAWAFVWVLFLLGIFRGYTTGKYGPAALPFLVLISAMSMLDHPLTGAWGQAGLWLFAVATPGPRRWRMVATVVLVEIAAIGLDCFWPWYNFRAAMTMKVPGSFVNIWVQMRMSTQWCVPAAALALFAFALRSREAVRVFLAGGYLSYLAGALIFVLPLWLPLVTAFTRFPMPGLIYFHLSLGVLAYEAGLFRPATWGGRLRDLCRGEPAAVTRAASELLLFLAVAYFLIPQVWHVVKEPYLMRPFIARLLHKKDKQQDLLPRFRNLLQGVGPRDVVLADEETMWIVPSVNGRIVYPLHPSEIFVSAADQEIQQHDVETFFTRGTPAAERLEVLKRHNVRWIVLNDKFMSEPVVDELLVGPAVVRRNGGLILMDAVIWARAHDSAAPRSAQGRAPFELPGRADAQSVACEPSVLLATAEEY